MVTQNGYCFHTIGNYEFYQISTNTNYQFYEIDNDTMLSILQKMCNIKTQAIMFFSNLATNDYQFCFARTHI
jgi:hypothetical protein